MYNYSAYDKEILKMNANELEKAIEAGTLSFDIASSKSAQNVVIKCTDKAGNELVKEISGFYVTTDLLVRYANNKTWIVISIIILIILLAGIVVIVVRKRKKS